jgi:aminopeptidase YwaD
VRWWLVSMVVLGILLAGCETAGGPSGAPRAPAESAAPAPGRATTPSRPQPPPPSEPDEAEQAPSTGPAPRPDRAGPVQFRRARARATVRWLAGRIGPRQATTAAYRRAARGVASRLSGLGYQVRRQRLRAPAGVSWGVPVPSGRTWNVVATPASFRPGRPHLLVGAHLDTVPQAPGAEDNASGVAVLLELARMAVQEGPRLPVVFVAFAAEEPRGEGEAMHHFGSRAYVNRMSARERRALQGMTSLDRVGVGQVVPACTGGVSPLTVRSQLVRAAHEAGVPVQTCSDNASSDHWQFELAGEAAARLGSTPYAGYHSPGDVPSVVNPAQLDRTGRLAWEWLSD